GAESGSPLRAHGLAARCDPLIDGPASDGLDDLGRGEGDVQLLGDDLPGGRQGPCAELHLAGEDCDCAVLRDLEPGIELVHRYVQWTNRSRRGWGGGSGGLELAHV